jgi:hypothetical protein
MIEGEKLKYGEKKQPGIHYESLLILGHYMTTCSLIFCNY